MHTCSINYTVTVNFVHYCSGPLSRPPVANESVLQSVVTPLPLPSYEVCLEDTKVNEDKAKEPPPDYSALSRTGVGVGDVPSYYWEPTTAL